MADRTILVAWIIIAVAIAALAIFIAIDPWLVEELPHRRPIRTGR
jgi:hypothetical protein